MRETALLDLTKVNVHGLHLRVELYVLDVHNLQFLTEAHHSDVAILQINHLISIFDDRTGIRTEIKLSVLTDTHYQWTLLAGSNNLVRVTLVKNCDGISANHLTERNLNGSQQIKILLHLNVFDELNEHLCISLALELHTLGNQVLLDVGIVLDNTIMNHGKILAGRIMRMSIHSRRLTVSSPTSMSDTHMSRNILVSAERFKICHLTLCLIYVQRAIIANKGYTRRVIPAVFQTLQPLDESWISVSLT